MLKKQRNREEFEADLAKVSDNIKLIGEFRCVDSRLQFRCNIDGCEFERGGFKILETHTCPECHKREFETDRKNREQEFLSKMRILHPDIDVLSKFTNTKTKVNFRCKVCGHEWKSIPESLILQNTGCPKCAGNLNMTQEEFEDKVYSNKNTADITIIGKYKNYGTSVKCYCKKHDLEFYSYPTTLFNGKTICPKCSKNYSYTNDEFVTALKNVTVDILPLEHYVSAISKIKVRCLKENCGKEWMARPSTLLHGYGCPYCAGNLEISEAEFLDKFENKNFNMKFNTDFIGYQKPINVTCLNDGNTFWTTPSRLIGSKLGCVVCAGTVRKTQEEFVSQLYEKYPNLEVLGQYKNVNTRVLVRCKDCGRNFYGVPQQMLIGIGCPHCRISHLAKDIRSFLESNNISHKAEYRIKECRYKRPLPFDFAIFKDNILISLIEADGRQHYESIEYFGGNKAFKLQQIKDKIKTDYCIAHSIPLIRIPYTEIKNIPEILQREIIEKYNI